MTQKMSGEKLTPVTDSRLTALLDVLKNSPYKSDAEIPASYTSILLEVSENLATISYHADDWHKSNKLKKMKKGSAVRHKLQQVTQSIVNLTKLLETVAQIPAPAYQTYYDNEGDEFEQSMGGGIVRQATRSKDAQAMMDTLSRFEERIN